MSNYGKFYATFRVTRAVPGQVTSRDRLRIDVEERSPGLRQRGLSGSITVGEVS